MNLRTYGSAALGLLLTLSLPAAAQDVPFESLEKRSMAPMSFRADGHVARTAKELTDLKLDRLVGPSALATVDWSKDMVIAVVMGPQSSGGFGIVVEKVQYRMTPFTTPGGALGGARHLEVTVRKLSPAPGISVPKVITNPYQVIKLAKTSARVVFREAAAPASASAYNSIKLTMSSRSPADSHPLYQSVSVDKQGNARVTRTHPLILFQPIPSLKLKVSDLRTLDMLVRNARAASIPSNLTPSLMTLAQPFTLEIDSPVSSLANPSIQGLEGTYGAFGPRLDPLIAFLRNIEKKVTDAASGLGLETKGTVQVTGWRGWRTVYLVNGNTRVKVSPWSFARTLIPLKGYEVQLEGSWKNSPANDEFLATKLLSPTLQRINGISRATANGPVLDQRFVPVFPARPDMKLVGPLAALVGSAQGRRISGEAWVFAPKSAPKALFVTVYGNAKSTSDLTSYGRRVNGVNAGDAVTILAVSRTGRWVKVQPDSGRAGYMRMTNLSVGELNAPLHTGNPGGPPLKPMTGIGSAVTGTTGN